MKKFLNDPATLVPDSLRGLESAHRDLVRVDADRGIVLRADAPVAGKVGVVSGGGAGHEPMHAGFVGRGMLDAACCGAVFTAPVPDAIVAATVGVDGGAGVLHVIKNYTGDVMSFGLAAETAGARGIPVASVVVDDDASVTDAGTAGRRGTGVTLVVEKVAGAKAAAGGTLEQVRAVAQRANDSGRSLGVALTSGVPPALGRPLLDIGPEEMELGVGIHGEPGRRRVGLRSAREIATWLLDVILVDLGRLGDAPLLVFVNGFGGTPLMELYLLYHEVETSLRRRGLRVARSLVGNYVTSLETAGASVSLVALDDELLELWDAPVLTPGLRWGA